MSDLTAAAMQRLQQKRDEIAEQRRKELAAGGREEHEPTAVGDTIENIKEMVLDRLGLTIDPDGAAEVETALPIDKINLTEHFGLVSLDDLTVDHMPEDIQQGFMAMLMKIGEWRDAVDDHPGLSLVLTSDNPGVGKTKIARAMVDSFSRVIFGSESLFAPIFPSDLALVREGAFRTSREIMEMAAESFYIDPKIRMLVIDDVGREGIIRYVKTDVETQTYERQARYYSVVDYCYRNKVSLLLTSNLSYEELKGFFDEATWSRLRQMAPAGYVWEISGVPDFREHQGIDHAAR